MTDNSRTWGSISREVFQISLTTYLILLILETLKTGFVNNFVNINILLPIIITSGIAMTLLSPLEKREEQRVIRLKETDLYYILFMSIAAGGLIYFKTQELGWVSIVIAGISGVCILFISLLIFTDRSS